MLVRNTLALVAVLVLTTSALAAPKADQQKFLRGDCQVDGAFNMTDVIVIFLAVTEGRRVECEKACDANNDGMISTVDVLAVMDVFVGKTALASPFPECGLEDELEEEEQEQKDKQVKRTLGEGAKPLTCESHEACL